MDKINYVNFLKVIFSGCVILLCLSSCVEDGKIRYLGYTSFYKEPDSFDNGSGYLDAKGDVGYGSNSTLGPYFTYVPLTQSKPYATQPYIPSKLHGHSHYYQKDLNKAMFCPEGYVSESDINELQEKLQSISMRTIKRILAPMRDGIFMYDDFSKKYGCFLSNGVKDKIMSVKVNSIFTDLGGWQMLKPTEGLDNKDLPFPYNVEYKGDEWYEITAPQIAGSSPVRVKVGYVGKYFNSIIVGLKNEKMNIDVYDTDYSRRYKNKILTFTPYDGRSYSSMQVKYLWPIVYKEAGNNDFMKKADFDRVIKKVTAKENAFVHKFYDALIKSGNDIRKIQKAYRYQMARYLATKADEQILKEDFGVDMFLPCSYEDFSAGYDVEYLGQDNYKVTARKGGKSVFLIVVLYGPKQTPAIMAMINPTGGIDYCPDRFRWATSVKGQ